MSKTKKLTEKIVHLAILVSIGVIFSLIDKYISALIFPSIPGARIGFANIIILIGILNYDFKDCLILALLKSLISGLLFSGLTTFIIGGTATMISFFAMYFLKKIAHETITNVGISCIGGLLHTITQLFVIMLIYNMGADVFVYGAYLLAISLVSSILIGVLSIKINIIYKKIYNNDNNKTKDFE